jgi:hypothetical protein
MAGEAKPPKVRGASRTLVGETDPNRLGKRLSNEGHGFTGNGKIRDQEDVPLGLSSAVPAGLSLEIEFTLALTPDLFQSFAARLESCTATVFISL